MALSLRLLPFSSTRWRPSLAYNVHQPRGHVVTIVRSVFDPSTTGFAAPLILSRLLSASGKHGHSSARCHKATAQTKQLSFRVLSSLRGGSTADDPIENRKDPRLQWILFTVVLAAGLVLFLKLRGLKGGFTSMGGEVPALQANAVIAAPEGAARFHVKLPIVGSISLQEVTPGWVYFVLLMAAGFGLFVSEEALNVWVGASLGRLLSYGSRDTFFTSFAENSPYILSTILWVYWGVCISDMVPFYAGKLASKRGDQLSKKLGVSKEQYEKVTGNIQRFGNLIGFVERFSLGARNPTSFLAGFAGILPSRFFAGVCLGGLVTLPIQLSIGFALRERPMAALAGVAAVVSGWTVFPYVAAGAASFYYLLRHKIEKPSK